MVGENVAQDAGELAAHFSPLVLPVLIALVGVGDERGQGLADHEQLLGSDQEPNG
jgi:hypothetical protein